MHFSPIGYVDKDTIVIDKKYLEALEGIEEFSHIIVVWVFSESQGYTMKVHPKGRADIPLVGLFATRTPFRPNPIAVSLVKLIKRVENRLLVEGLEAYDKTPVLDIKPYIQIHPPKANFPNWLKKLTKI